MIEDTYSAKEAAKKLNMPLTTFYRKVKKGEIPYIRTTSTKKATKPRKTKEE